MQLTFDKSAHALTFAQLGIPRTMDRGRLGYLDDLARSTYHDHAALMYRTVAVGQRSSYCELGEGRRTVVASNEAVTKAILDLPAYVLLRVLQRDVHKAVETRQHADVVDPTAQPHHDPPSDDFL